MNMINLSHEPVGRLYGWLPHDLKYNKIVFFPDICPGRSPLPTGVAVSINPQELENWRKFTISDIGCGMTFMKSRLKMADFKPKDWDSVCNLLKANKGNKGDLGSSNHFLDAVVSYSDDHVYFVIHTGSRLEGESISKLIDNPYAFDKEYESVVNWAIENRIEVRKIIEKVFGKTEFILDTVHNSYEKVSDEEVIIRKGTVHLKDGEYNILPSSMEGDMVLVKAKPIISDYLSSLGHGSGRKFSRGTAKEMAKDYDYNALRKRIYIPSMISNDSIKTEAPFCYRDLDECLQLIEPIVEEVDRYIPIAYIGQL